MRVCGSRAENNTRKETVCQVSVLAAPLCVNMRTTGIVSQERARNIHYSTGRNPLNLIKSAFRYSLRNKKKSTPYVQNTSVRPPLRDLFSVTKSSVRFS
jgi:hypothetical protein